MKNFVFSLGLMCCCFFFCNNSHAQKAKEPEQIISFDAIYAGILRVFPETYEDFVTICFTRMYDFILPETATFMIPSKYFKSKLSQKELDKRAETLIEQLELAPACQTISYGDEEQYAWNEWEDKKVRKVTLHFGIGC